MDGRVFVCKVKMIVLKARRNGSCRPVSFSHATIQQFFGPAITKLGPLERASEAISLS